MLFGTRVRWDLTLNCNLSCRHCQVGDQLKHDGTHPQLQDVLMVVDKLMPSEVSHVGLLGGEPLSYPWIHLVLERLIDKGLPVTISTNGLLIDQRLVEIMRESFSSSIMISLEGPDEATHEKIRGRGTFKPTVKKIRYIIDSMKGYGTEIGLSCTLNAANFRHMRDMRTLARELGVDILQFATVKKQGNARYDYDSLAVSDRDLVRATLGYFREAGSDKIGDQPRVVIEFLDNPMKDVLRNHLGVDLPVSVSGCTAAVSTAAIDTSGRLWPCPSISYIRDQKVLRYFGFEDNSLLRNSFAEIWQSARFKKLRELNSRRLHSSQAVPCISCRYRVICTPCHLPYLRGRSLDQPTCINRFMALTILSKKD